MIDQVSQIMRVTVSDRVYVGGLSPHATKLFRAAAEIPNPAYARAVREHILGVEKKFVLWSTIVSEDRSLIETVPRGMLNQVCRGLDALGYDWAIDDRRIDPGHLRSDFSRVEFAPKLRDYQQEAIEEMLLNEQGIYEAPTGSGKTVTALGLILRAKVRTLIIVGKLDLARQWVDRIRYMLGTEPGQISGVFDTRGLIIDVATIQTLSAGRHNGSLAHDYGMVIVDECHHVTADSYRDVIDRCAARYRFGLSATPERQPGLLALAEAYLGPVIIRTPKDKLRVEGHILVPEVKAIKTAFEFPYVPTHRGSDGKLRRNNWGQLVKALVADETRARTIALNICMSPKWKQLVISRNLSHLGIIAEMTVRAYEQRRLHKPLMHFLVGDMSEDDRRNVIRDVEIQNTVVIFSTLADEALDCPEFDAIHLTYPTSSPALLTQQIGRVVRPSDAKSTPIIYDYFDHLVPVLKEQHFKRRRLVYTPEGLPYST